MSLRLAVRALRAPETHRFLSCVVNASSPSYGSHLLPASHHPPQQQACRDFLVHTPLVSSCFFDSRSFSASSVAASSKVVVIKDDAHYVDVMNGIKSKDALGVVYFTAQWCGPCKQIAPYIEELSQQFDNVTFVKVDVDKLEVEETMKSSQIGVVPTFHFHKKGELIGEITGAVKDKLKNLVETLRPKP